MLNIWLHSLTSSSILTFFRTFNNSFSISSLWNFELASSKSKSSAYLARLFPFLLPRLPRDAPRDLGPPKKINSKTREKEISQITVLIGSLLCLEQTFGHENGFNEGPIIDTKLFRCCNYPVVVVFLNLSTWVRVFKKQRTSHFQYFCFINNFSFPQFPSVLITKN